MSTNPDFRRQFGYAATFAGLALGFLWLHSSAWMGDVQLHTLMELAATLLALFVSVLALIRYYSQKDDTFLFIGAGFFGTGLLDGYHAVVTSQHFAWLFPSTPPSLIPWSWFASRLFLSMSLCLSWYFWQRERKLGEAGWVNETTVYGLFTALTAACFVFFTLVPMATGYGAGLMVPRPQEFIPAILFAVALIGYLHKGRWRTDSFEHWLVLSLIVGFASQAMFMPTSGRLYDGMFNAAHWLKILSYICVLAGLLVNMYRLFRLSAGDPILVQNSATGAFVSVNQRLANLFGYTPEQMLGLDMRALSAGAPPWTPGDLPKLLRQFPPGRPQVFEWQCRAKDGRLFWAEIDLQRGGAFAGSETLVSRVRDISERKQAEDALAYGDGILQAVTIGTAELVAGESLAAGMLKALRIVGETINVDRVLVLENNPEPFQPPLLRHAWQAANIAVRMDQAVLLAGGPEEAKALGLWLAPLCDGKPVIGRLHDMEGPVRRMLERLQNKSMLLMPIVVGDSLWGMIGIDECKRDREWTATEIDVLETFAKIIGIVIVRNNAQLSLQKSEERFRAVSETAQDAIIMADAAGRVEYWNRAAERTLGYTAAEAHGQDVHRWITPQGFREQATAGMRTFAATGHGDVFGKTLERAALRKDGVEIPIDLCLAGMRIGQEWHSIAILRDISERKQAEAQIARMARHDALTGLVNRAAFIEAMEHAIALYRRGGRGFALLSLDLDHFKDINDTLGHPVGDRLLQDVAERLGATIRKSDIVARFGGDEFAVIGTDIRDPQDAAVLAGKLIKAIGAPYSIQGNLVRTNASIGIAMYGPDAPDAETLLSHADLALYCAKSQGRGAYHFFTDSLNTEMRTRVTLGDELRSGIAAGQLFLMYQPQVDAPTGRVTGVEALVRWRHPLRGVILPAEFIPVAEKNGLIVALGHWVLVQACRQMKEWLNAGIAPPLVAVNVSALQFRRPLELAQDIDSVLQQTGVPPDKLELELPGGVLMDASHEHGGVLLRLRRAGLRIAINDFGTGYLSLDYLRRFPVDRLKVAQSFAPDLTPASGNAATVRAAIGLGHEFNMKVVVERVETGEQLNQIVSWGCRQVQGYYFSRPLTPEDIRPILNAGVIQALQVI